MSNDGKPADQVRAAVLAAEPRAAVQCHVHGLTGRSRYRIIRETAAARGVGVVGLGAWCGSETVAWQSAARKLAVGRT